MGGSGPTGTSRFCAPDATQHDRAAAEYGCFDGAISAGGYVSCDGQVLVDLPHGAGISGEPERRAEQHGVDYTLESRDEIFAGPKMTARWKFTADAPDKPLNSEAARWRKAMQTA